MKEEALDIHFNGIVQGVGFRPFVYNLAEELNIKGWVSNSSHGLRIHAEGVNSDLFYQRLLDEAPPLAQILTVRSWPGVFENFTEFEIVGSEKDQVADVLILPDVVTCPDCLADIADPENRRYQYPFTNCTNCGPRYTIIRDVPYDRARTTMAEFPMCQVCAAEYGNPRDRRFHAQPVACGDCGPQVRLLDGAGNLFPGMGVEELAQGAILAVKGLGGFHLVCNARNREAVQRLRRVKERGAKPFALMARSVEDAAGEVFISRQEELLLQSAAAPIVLLERQPRRSASLAEDIAPGLHTLGVMLPYTPLHHLLFQGPFDFLVMTSANLSGRPLIYKNDEALKGLKGIADYYLLHDREIEHPCDDSVVQVIGEQAVYFRRARGYVPLPVLLDTYTVKQPILAVGGELKNAFCLAEGQRAFVSQYIGDMEGFENLQRFHQELASFQRVVNIVPQALAYDCHPDYQLTRYALGKSGPKQAVQHHHAHLVSVLGEWDRREPTLGVICDGTGWGEDQSIWGFEFLYGNAAGYERRGHLEYLGLPGGDAGVKKPLRIAYAYCKTLLSAEMWEEAKPLWTGLAADERRILDRQLETGVQVFPTSSAGRLFDAVSALLGVCRTVTYEGQAAIELESAATRFGKKMQETAGKSGRGKAAPFYSYEVRAENRTTILGIKPLLTDLLQDIFRDVAAEEIAYRFHITIARAIVDVAIRLGVEEGPLVLSGGVFQNKLLTETVLEYCQEKEIQVLRARTIPPGDGGLALGQLLIANEVL